MNKTILIGRLTKDPELKTLPNGTTVTNFTLAVNRPFTNAEGEKESDFINCITFGKQAETLVKYVSKGNLLGVEGRIQTRTYNAQDGSNRYVTEVVCNSFVFLESKKEQKSNDEYTPYDMSNPKYNKKEEENLPF